MCEHVLEKLPNIKFRENSFSYSEVTYRLIEGLGDFLNYLFQTRLKCVREKHPFYICYLETQYLCETFLTWSAGV
jgi:hypothetical protein